MSANRARWGLPPRPFLYTLDQIADLLGVAPADLNRYLYRQGIDVGIIHRGRLLARNIAPSDGGPPTWRVDEVELVRWLRNIGFTPLSRSIPPALTRRRDG